MTTQNPKRLIKALTIAFVTLAGASVFTTTASAQYFYGAPMVPNPGYYHAQPRPESEILDTQKNLKKDTPTI